MYWIIFTLSFYFLFTQQIFASYREIPSGIDLLIFCVCVIGFVSIAIFIRTHLRNTTILHIWKETEPRIAEYRSKYGAESSGQKFIGQFGSGFAEGWTEEAIKDGDLFGVVIGGVISLAADWISNIGKTEEQKRLEQLIKTNLQAIESAKSSSDTFTVMAIITTVVMSVLGTNGFFVERW